jgi:hypothetical protein
MKKSTLKKIQYKSKANDRVVESWSGASKVLAFIKRAVPEIEVSQLALDVLSEKYRNF